jgi:hypothetical protein
MTNYEQEQCPIQINHPSPNLNPITQVKPKQPNLNPTPVSSQTQRRQRHQRIPSQPMQLSKNGRQTFPLRLSANIKGTVSGTFVPLSISARSAFYASRRGYVNALSYPDRFSKILSFAGSFQSTLFALQQISSFLTKHVRHAVTAWQSLRHVFQVCRRLVNSGKTGCQRGGDAGNNPGFGEVFA